MSKRFIKLAYLYYELPKINDSSAREELKLNKNESIKTGYINRSKASGSEAYQFIKNENIPEFEYVSIISTFLKKETLIYVIGPIKSIESIKSKVDPIYFGGKGWFEKDYDSIKKFWKDYNEITYSIIGKQYDIFSVINNDEISFLRDELYYDNDSIDSKMQTIIEQVKIQNDEFLIIHDELKKINDIIKKTK